ncbi:uncharacterized protein JCM15063_005988 [Sporobolomyces koalae]|uniref:uncharacterized protein n=1 Tax=Sporobolomyces koalae TaxID=500713 RepID=UPI0031797FAD
MAPKRTANGPPSLRQRKRTRSTVGQLGATTAADDTARLIASHHLAEHAGGGATYLAIKQQKSTVVPLKHLCIEQAALAIYEVVRLSSSSDVGKKKSSNAVGWDPQRDTTTRAPVIAIQHAVSHLPEETANRLLAQVLFLSYQALQVPNDPGVSVLSLAAIFFSDRISRLSFASLAVPSVLLNRIHLCTALVDLDLSHSPTLRDVSLSKVLAQLALLSRINLKACTKVGDESIKALSRASGRNLRSANLSFTAVGTRGLSALVTECPSLEVLKLEAVGNLNEKNVNAIVEAAMSNASATAFPLSRLQCLKLKNTLVTDAALGRLLALCAPTLARLDLSYTQCKSLDLVSAALESLPEWHLTKICLSGLPLTPATLETFFRIVAERPVEQRERFKVLKLGSIPASSTRAPGLTDDVFKRLMPSLESLTGLESLSLFGNIYLARSGQPMTSIISRFGKQCRVLNLTSIPIESWMLEGLAYPDSNGESEEGFASNLETLVLDSTRIDDEAAQYLSHCKKLKGLHVAETRITPKFLDVILESCPDLSTLNLTSCRGVPVTQRRTYFDTIDA